MSSEDISTDWVDPDDAPELTDEWFDKADIKIGDRIVRRDRPAGSAKQQVTLDEFRQAVMRRRAALGQKSMPRNSGERHTESKRGQLEAIEATGKKW